MGERVGLMVEQLPARLPEIITSLRVRFWFLNPYYEPLGPTVGVTDTAYTHITCSSTRLNVRCRMVPDGTSSLSKAADHGN